MGISTPEFRKIGPFEQKLVLRTSPVLFFSVFESFVCNCQIVIHVSKVSIDCTLIVIHVSKVSIDCTLLMIGGRI